MLAIQVYIIGEAVCVFIRENALRKGKNRSDTKFEEPENAEFKLLFKMTLYDTMSVAKWLGKYILLFRKFYTDSSKDGN